MDSGNSGSMQSSSAGEEEYESRASASTDAFSAFLNTGNFLSPLTPPPPPPPVSLSISTSAAPNPNPTALFDHDVTPFSHSYALDSVWPQAQTYQTTTLPPQSPSPLLLGGPNPGPSSQRPLNDDASRPDQPHPPVVKNPRKRTRASRRAPTTVLTTDTSNFRQMVQEFTGIPSPPFSATTSSSRRLDLFGQLYPVRPSAQKVANSASTIANVVPNNSALAPPTTSNNIFSTTYSQLLSNPAIGGFATSLQNQLLSHPSLMFGSSKNTQGDSLVEMGITQDHINANLSAFLGETKGIGRDNNRDGLQDTNVIATRNEEAGINSWNFSQEL